jgi:2-polyprenyl-3-methyl-5-hydroxy-6-metoxy-1,4-benzoquinol methylase
MTRCLRHKLRWDDSKITAFWNYIAESQSHQKDYFAKQVGAEIVNFLHYLVPLKGRILDYGCGPGYLARHLIQSGIRCEGCDSSEKTVRLVNEEFMGNQFWGGAKLLSGEKFPYADDTFDLIICLETIEHLLDLQLEITLREFSRIIKPRTGRLFITTPNSEDLALSEVFCPDCGAVFHRYQHIRAFTQDTLAKLMAEKGFRTEKCDATLFNLFRETPIKNPSDWNARYLMELSKGVFFALLDVIRLPNAPTGGYRLNRYLSVGPHLFWFGSK